MGRFLNEIWFRTLVLPVVFLFTKIALACTAFGVITESGTIMAKNRDASYYAEQKFELIRPIKQFDDWFNNPYHHRNKFYALMAQSDVKMGVNESGLAVIEEDPLYPNANRRYLQPINGNAEGMILFGVLQNFSTIDEIIPSINQIFSSAAPNFYQISDNKKILTVEVAYASDDTSPLRSYRYKVVDKKNQYFTHTNLYLFPEFDKLNYIESTSGNKIKGADRRRQRIEWQINNQKFNNIYNWLMDTDSNLISSDIHWCQNTSVFRSNLQGLGKANVNMKNHGVYGTVSNIILENNGSLKQSHIMLRIVDSIDTQPNQNQVIHYRELYMTLEQLFSENNPIFKNKSFIRTAPTINGCK